MIKLKNLENETLHYINFKSTEKYADVTLKIENHNIIEVKHEKSI